MLIRHWTFTVTGYMSLLRQWITSTFQPECRNKNKRLFPEAIQDTVACLWSARTQSHGQLQKKTGIQVCVHDNYTSNHELEVLFLWEKWRSKLAGGRNRSLLHMLGDFEQIPYFLGRVSTCTRETRKRFPCMIGKPLPAPSRSQRVKWLEVLSIIQI